MSQVAEVVINSPENPIVQIDRKLFTRIEDQQVRVAETDRALKSAADEHKEAKKAHEAATDTLTALVAAMVRKVNGISDDAPLPLFDNQTDAIAAAESDPIVSTLIARMLDHSITHVNALIVAGYNEEQRNELMAYLDAMDIRRDAMAQPEGFEPLPEVVVPEFLVAQEADPIPDAAVVEALGHRSIELKKKHIKLMSEEQRATVLAWDAKCHEVETRLGEAVTYDDLPEPPSFIINPKELEPVKEATEGEPTEPVTEAEPVKKARATRRSSEKFKNTPKMAGKVTSIKGRKRQAVN